MVEIVGSYPPRPRLITDLYSLDRAFVNTTGKLGIPIGHGYELFGSTYTGKSTFALSLAGIIAGKQNENISLIDLEGFDPDHLIEILRDFPGKLHISSAITDEDQLDGLITDLRKNNCGVGILDSIGAISPLSEAEGEVGEANMGRRALAMAQFSRKALKLFRFSKTPKTILAINHYYPQLGGTKYQYITPGGEVKKYLLSVRILMKVKETFPDQSYVIEGTVKKNRWGMRNKMFYVFMLSGKGIHYGMSWMYDGFINGTVKRGKSVKIGETSMGRPGDILKHAHAGDNEFFLPFREAVYSGQQIEKEIEDDIEGDNKDEEE